MLTHKRLLSLLDYNLDTGVFTWKVQRGFKAIAGSVAGCWRTDGYRMLTIDDIHYKASRVAWFYMTGRWPQHQVDHINRNPGDDRFANLREASGSKNTANRILKLGRGGYRGIYAHQGKWRARIMVNYKKIDLGMYEKPEDAALAYDRAAVKFFGEFAIVNFQENRQ